VGGQVVKFVDWRGAVVVVAELVAVLFSDDGGSVCLRGEAIEIGAQDRVELERIVRSSTAEVRIGKARPPSDGVWNRDDKRRSGAL
jgi:hypothetical protein